MALFGSDVLMERRHVVEVTYLDWNGEPDEADFCHIEAALEKGYREGEILTGEEQHRGWWKLIEKDFEEKELEEEDV